jgi:hypothetical protein
VHPDHEHSTASRQPTYDGSHAKEDTATLDACSVEQHNIGTQICQVLDRHPIVVAGNAEHERAPGGGERQPHITDLAGGAVSSGGCELVGTAGK